VHGSCGGGLDETSERRQRRGCPRRVKHETARDLSHQGGVDRQLLPGQWSEFLEKSAADRFPQDVCRTGMADPVSFGDGSGQDGTIDVVQ
jgi:hypothetical protein